MARATPRAIPLHNVASPITMSVEELHPGMSARQILMAIQAPARPPMWTAQTSSPSTTMPSEASEHRQAGVLTAW
jgi:hypothetical protein